VLVHVAASGVGIATNSRVFMERESATLTIFFPAYYYSVVAGEPSLLRHPRGTSLIGFSPSQLA